LPVKQHKHQNSAKTLKKLFLSVKVKSWVIESCEILTAVLTKIQVL